jgi:glycosyltransferase involved in cell wall biosynthesis
VVVTSVGGIPETVADGDNGLLVPARDSAALATALERVLTDDALRARLGRRARASVEQRYSCKVVGDQLSAIWRDLAGAR